MVVSIVNAAHDRFVPEIVQTSSIVVNVASLHCCEAVGAVAVY